MISTAKAALSFFLLFAAIGLIIDGSEALADGDRGWETYSSIALGVTGIPITILVGVSSLAATFARKARLEVGPHQIVLHHRGVFRKPVTIPRADVAAADFDLRKARLKRFRDHKRFGFDTESRTETSSSEPEWLFSKASGAPFPVLSQAHDVPNLALCFTEPIKLSPTRRWMKLLPARASLHPPIHDRRARGLLLRVKDPDKARDAFLAWGLPAIERSHLEALRPTAADRRKVKILAALDGGLIAGVLGTTALLPFILARETNGNVLSPARGVCEQMEAALEAHPYEPVDVDPPALLDSFMPSEVDDRLVLLAGDRFNPADQLGGDLQRVIAETSSERAYASHWASPDVDLYVELFQMRNSGDAAGLVTRMRAAICADANEVFAVPSVMGAVGMRWLGTAGIVDHIVMQRDEFGIWIAVIERSDRSGIETARGVAEEMDRRIR